MENAKKQKNGGPFSNLNPAQTEAVNHLDGPLLIAAGAGSGKTKTLTGRLIKLIESGVNPAIIAAVTFTNKAANEMADRVAQIANKNAARFALSALPFIGTLHSFGARILKNEAAFFKRNKNFSIFDDDDSLRLIKRLIQQSNLDREKYPPIKIQNKISFLKNELIAADRYRERAENDFQSKTAEVFKKYELALQKNNAFDFDDLIEKPVRLFQKNKAALQKYQKKIQYLLVDEYQDINTSQYWLLKLLADQSRNICVVGDDNQAIYSFRQADFRNFLNFEKDWPRAKVVLLEENYRSSQNIIKAASALIANNQFQKPKTLWTRNAEGEPISVFRFGLQEDEADFIAGEAANRLAQNANRIGNERFATNDSRLAVLYRTNAQSRAVEQALIEREIPYEIFGGVRFYERKEIKDLLAGLRLALNPRDSVSRERLEKNFNRKIAGALIKELPVLGRLHDPVRLIEFFIETSDYNRFLENNFKNWGERLENIEELIDFARPYDNVKPPAGLQLFLEQVSLAQPTDTPANRKAQSANHDSRKRFAIGDSRLAVNLMTIHLAKGLEFDSVFVAGCNEGLLPHHRSCEKSEDLEEERRLMYVAMTRARHKLFLTFFETPSRFLHEIPPELINFEDRGGGNLRLDDDEIYIEYA